MKKRTIWNKNKSFILILDTDIFEQFKDKGVHLSSNGYAMIKLDKKNIRLHRYIMNAKSGEFVDHINGNKLDNRRKNLRICTISQNMMNTTSRKNSTSSYLGVSYNRTLMYWVAEVRLNKKRVHCSYHSSELEAALTRDKYAKKYHKKFAKLNFHDYN